MNPIMRQYAVLRLRAFGIKLPWVYWYGGRLETNPSKGHGARFALAESPGSLEGRCLDLLRAPAGIRFPHVGRGLDRGNELEGDISHTDQANDGAGNNPQDVGVEEDAANEDIEDTTADEREKERSVARDLRRNLEFKKTSGKTENDNVYAHNHGLESGGEELRNSAQDHDDRNHQVDDPEGVGEVHLV